MRLWTSVMSPHSRTRKRKVRSPASVLWTAAESGDAKKVAQQLSMDDVQETSPRAKLLKPSGEHSGGSVLGIAAAQGHTAVLAMLIEHGIKRGADLSKAIDATGDTLLHCACYGGHLSCVELLVMAGLDPLRPNACGETPIDVCTKFGHTACVRLLRGEPPLLSDAKPVMHAGQLTPPRATGQHSARSQVATPRKGASVRWFASERVHHALPRALDCDVASTSVELDDLEIMAIQSMHLCESTH
jgi:ankyrin repeat protein